jgi:hypothetical protein
MRSIKQEARGKKLLAFLLPPAYCLLPPAYFLPPTVTVSKLHISDFICINLTLAHLLGYLLFGNKIFPKPLLSNQ